jgi:CDP-glycerol glycerophosphotransferase (TagB/SpsB family)
VSALRQLAREQIGTFRLLLLLRLVQWPFRSLLRPIVRRMPRDPSLVAFGAASNRFADNPAYAFLAASASASLRCVWISGSRATVAKVRSLGLRAEHRWRPRGIWTVLRAGWLVHGWNTADVNLWLGDGARTFNLWHGVGVKRIQRARVVGTGAAIYGAPERSFLARVFADDRHVPDLVLSTSPGMTPVLAQAFDVPTERCPELGYPRNDHLVERSRPPTALVDGALYDRLDGRRVVGYFPTFRDDSLSIPGGAPVISRLADIVGRQDAVVVFKAHDSSEVRVAEGEALIVLPADCDLNAYLGLCDVLVTDYSSVASDFLLLGRPIVLFVPDLEDYTSARGFALDPRSYLPGLVTSTADELYRALSALDDLEPPSNAVELTRFYWGTGTAGAGAAIRALLEAGH